jgi:prepilin-type processing-associated H-X9-DG protein
MMAGNQSVFWCPSTDTSFQWKPGEVIPGAAIATTAHEGWGYNAGESVLQVDKKQFSYGYNDWGTVDPYQSPMVGLGGDCWMSNAGTTPDPREPNSSEVRRSSECIVVTDVIAKLPVNGSWLMNVDPRDTTQCPAKIHSKGSNALFCDGHVTWMLQFDLCCFDPKTNIVKTGDPYDRVSRLWNRDNLPH